MPKCTTTLEIGFGTQLNRRKRWLTTRKLCGKRKTGEFHIAELRRIFSFAVSQRSLFKYEIFILFAHTHRLWPSYASAHNNLGTLMSTASKAESHFKLAIRYSGEHVNAHYNLGQLYRKLNRTVEAARMFERCILLDSSFAPAYLELIKLRSGTVAGRLLREVIRMNPTEPDRLALYGFWLLDNRKKKRISSDFGLLSF